MKSYGVMELHQLKYFEAAARLGSMMAAAAECHVSQPAMSVQIRKLESECGAPLLVRGARGVSLTPAGERTLGMARRVLREVGVWEADMRAGAYAATGALRVAAQPFLASEILPGPVADTLRAGGPGERLRLRERAASLIPSLLASGECDLALVDMSPEPMAGFAVEVLLKIPYVLCLPSGHALAGGTGPVPLAALADHAVLLYVNAPGLEARLAELSGGDAAREPGFVSEHASAVFELVAAGAGVAVLPAVYMKAAARRGVEVRALADYAGQVIVAAAHRRGEALPPLAARLLKSIRRKHREWAVVAGEAGAPSQGLR